MMNNISYELDKNGIAILSFDDPDSSVNSLNRADIEWMVEFLGNIDRQLDMIENEDEIRAVVLCSNKKDSFINGGDICEYLNFTLADEGRVYSLRAQEVTERMESSRVPFIAAINGKCYGMGFELVLACAYRIASEKPETCFGMTGIEAGLIPSAGGTQRLPRLIGTREALDMIISGDSFQAYEALEHGLIDEVVPEEILIDISLERALQISQKEFKPRRSHFKGIQHTIVNENPIARKKLFNDFRKEANKNRQSPVNAPLMAIEALEVGMSSFNRGLHVESVYFGELVVSSATRSMIRTQMALEKVREESGDNETGIEPVPIANKIAVIGPMRLGKNLISLAADHGIRVRFKGEDDDEVGLGFKHCYDHFLQKLNNKEISELDFEKGFDLISGTSDYSGLKRARMVFECLDENLKLKLEALKDIEPLLLSETVYLSTSYVYPVAGIATNSLRPDRVLGVRLFTGRQSSKLAEISVTENTSPQALSKVIEFFNRLGKIPIIINGSTGSYTTRIQLVYFNEALSLVSEGVSIETIEDSMLRLGFDQGPFQFIDEIGIDLVLQASNIIFEVQGDKIKPHPSLGLLVSNERLGVKNSQGFYKYYKGNGKFDKSVYKFFPINSEKSDSLSSREIQERLMLALVNEALICLDEKVIKSPQDGDIAALLALGFPTVIGGPFNYIDSEGPGEVLKKLHNLSIKYGVRFISPALLKDISASGKKFYNS